jgi:hypothetical protein
VEVSEQMEVNRSGFARWRGRLSVGPALIVLAAGVLSAPANSASAATPISSPATRAADVAAKTPTGAGAAGPRAMTPLAAASISTNGNGYATDVGTWLITYNNASMWQTHFHRPFPIMHRPLDQHGGYSIPESADGSQIDFYLAQMASAGIDFVLLEDTNGGFPGTPYGTDNAWIVSNSALVAQRIKIWNDSHSWKIKYAVAIGTHDAVCQSSPGVFDDRGLCAERQARSVWDHFANHPSYGGSNYYYYVNGAPLLVLYSFNVHDPLAQWHAYGGDKTYGNRYTVRGANDSKAGEYGWQAASGPQIHPEVEVVSPGWNNHNAGGNYSRERGNRYQRDWNTVIASARPRIVMIQSFNDYHEDSAIWTADTTAVDTNTSERWIGDDGAFHHSQYWDATVANIAVMRGTTPVDLARGATARSSSVYGPLPASNLTDGNRATVFSSATGNVADHTEWAEVHLPARTTFGQVTLVSRGDGQYGFPRDFQIQVWDGSNWLTRVTRTNHPAPAAGQAVSFSWGFEDTTNRIRVHATSLGIDTNGQRLLQLGAFEVYRPAPPPPNLARGGAATSSTVYGPLPASNLTDGNRASVYSSATGNSADHTEWVRIGLPSVRTFNQVKLVSRGDGPYGFPRDFQIQVWDGSNWLTRVTRTNHPVPAGGAVETFSWGFADTTDAVRVLATSLGTDTNGQRILQLGEVELYNV